MKNKRLLVVSLLCALISIESFSQTGGKRYYYAFDEKIFLDSVENKMIVSFQRDSLAFIQTQSGLTETEWQNDGVFIVSVENSQMAALKSDLLQLGGIKAVQPMFAVDEAELGVTDEIVMKFYDGVSQQEIDSLHAMYQASVVKTTDLYQLISIPNTADALEIANQYQLSGLVDYSHPNFLVQIEMHQVIPNDPYFANQFYLHNEGQTMANGKSGTAGADIRAPQAWNITKGSSDIIVAVIDQGVTSNHPDLPNSRQVRLPGSNFATDPNLPGAASPDDPSPYQNENHGNACAGIIAASHNNEGIAGIAPNCNIMPLRFPYGFFSDAVLVDMITFAKENGAHILSNSWSLPSPKPNFIPNVRRAIEDAILNGRGGKGCVVVFSAGNTANHAAGKEGEIRFPSNVAGVLTVGASDRYDQQANYSPTSDLSSPQNQIIDILAPSHRAYSCQIPGETFEVWTIDIPGTPGYNPNKTTDCSTSSLPPHNSSMPSSGTNYLAYTGYMGGTSSACPQVAGVAALILSLNPDLTQQQVSDIIKSTARKAGGYTYQITLGIDGNDTWNPQMGHGVLNAYAALLATQETLPYNVLGTVFPFVHYGDSEIDALFNVTAELYAVPAIGSTWDPVGYISRPTTTPLYTTTAVHYDGSIFVPGTPKNPGYTGSLLNPGSPINWSVIGKFPNPNLIDNTTINPDEVPNQHVGLYYFEEAVAPGEYVLVLSRAGYLSRYAKITVPLSGKCIIEHREIIGGAIISGTAIALADANAINNRVGYVFGDSSYEARFDINGNAEIDVSDVSLAKSYIGFSAEEGYIDTHDFVQEYR